MMFLSPVLSYFPLFNSFLSSVKIHVSGEHIGIIRSQSCGGLSHRLRHSCCSIIIYFCQFYCCAILTEQTSLTSCSPYLAQRLEIIFQTIIIVAVLILIRYLLVIEKSQVRQVGTYRETK